MDAGQKNLRPNCFHFQAVKVVIIAKYPLHFHHHLQRRQTLSCCLFHLGHPFQACANGESKLFWVDLQGSMDVQEPLKGSCEFMGPKPRYSK